MTEPARVERLAGLRPGGGDPLLVIYGVGVDDAFIGHDHLRRGIQETLWELLHAQGYRRIVYSSEQYPVYFRDEASREASRARTRRKPAAAGRMRYFRGPLGDRILGGRGQGDRAQGVPADQGPAASADGGPDAPRVPDPGPSPGLPGSTGLADPYRLMMLDHLLRQRDVPTAVVFTQAEEQLRHVGSDRSLASVIAGWLEYGVGAGNLFVLLFRQPSAQDVRDFVAGLRRLPRLETRLGADGPPGISFAIGPPTEEELGRLVQMLRLGSWPGARPSADLRLRTVEWDRLPTALRAMSQMPGVRARDWEARLRQLAAEQTPLTVDELGRRGWIDTALADGRSVWERLAELRGLAPVKDYLEKLRWRLVAEAELRATGRATNVEPSPLHLVFQGSPGTGKTTVARLVGEMYRELGLLRRGHLVEVHARDLVAGYVGQTALKTSRKIDEALDGVLFIDEAHHLSDQRGGFGQEAISALVPRLTSDNDRLVVIIAGYRDKLAQFLATDEGLPRRFPPGNLVDFPDLTPGELHGVLEDELRRHGLEWTDELSGQLRDVVTGMYQTRTASFGNAGRMRLLADELRTAWAARIRGAIDEPLTPADLPVAYHGYLRGPAVAPGEVPDARR